MHIWLRKEHCQSAVDFQYVNTYYKEYFDYWRTKAIKNIIQLFSPDMKDSLQLFLQTTMSKLEDMEDDLYYRLHWLLENCAYENLYLVFRKGIIHDMDEDMKYSVGPYVSSAYVMNKSERFLLRDAIEKSCFPELGEIIFKLY